MHFAFDMQGSGKVEEVSNKLKGAGFETKMDKMDYIYNLNQRYVGQRGVAEVIVSSYPDGTPSYNLHLTLTSKLPNKMAIALISKLSVQIVDLLDDGSGPKLPTGTTKGTLLN